MNSDQLRRLPAIDELLHHRAIDELKENHNRHKLLGWARSAVQSVRQKILAGHDVPDPWTEVVERLFQEAKLDSRRKLQTVINATGVLLHTNLGRAPLANLAQERLQRCSDYTNLELDLDSGKRAARGARVCRLLAELTGAEDALVVNNCAAATILTLQTAAAGHEVIVSRGQLVEIGGGFRLPEVFERAGVRLREVGTTNRTYASDYENVLGAETGAILRVHRSNFFQAGFVAEPSIGELVKLKAKGVAVIDDLGSGHVVDLSQTNLPIEIKRESRVQDSVAAGVDLCLFSGDKLFGGPQCGIVVGKREWLNRLSKNPLMRALRADKMTLSALEATTEIHLAQESLQSIPFFQMLVEPARRIRERCDRIVAKLANRVADNSKSSIRASVCESWSSVGGGSMPQAQLESFAVCLHSASSAALSQRLRDCRPAVMGRVSEDRVLLDLRTVREQQIASLEIALLELVA